MRAVTCPKFGPPDLLTLGDLPVPGPGEVLVETRMAGVSFADTLTIRDLPHLWTSPRAQGESSGMNGA